ncbi:hypothetical protein MKX40_22285 [Paenibacillus sp. FSL R5-0517]|uniref:hypothetical protein n=1 Tax=Paenibacillus sp. FSL R5-0517 TaxID=2921647 RepID=UPI0030DC3462
MKDQFLKLISCFTEEDSLSGQINEQGKDFINITDRFNSVLNLKNDVAFVSEYKGKIIAPVPLASGGGDIKIVVFGLNPHLDTKESNKTIIEKEFAGDTWEEYSSFYNSDGVFKHVALPIGKYYREITPLATSLIEKEYISWLDFKLPSKEETSKKVIKALENFCAAEFVPFHSHKFKSSSSKIEELFDTIPQFKKYLTLLLETIHDSLTDDGWIVCNGSDSCNTFLDMIEKNEKLGSLKLIKDLKQARGYSFYYWGNRRVILLHHFYAAAGKGLKLSSNVEKKFMIEDAIATFN